MQSIRIVIGGPPNSGKSVLVYSLVSALWEIGLKARAVELDVWAPTLDYLEGKISKEERDARKRRSITKQEAEELSNRLIQASKDGCIAIGDCPGIITDELKIMLKNATHAIILCREDKIHEIQKWRNFFSEMGIQTIAELVSVLEGDEEIRVSSNKLIIGRLARLNREKGRKRSLAIYHLTFLLKSVLGL